MMHGLIDISKAYLYWFWLYSCENLIKIYFLTDSHSYSGRCVNLYLSLGKFSRRKIEKIFLFFQENRIWHLMPVVSIEDNVHEMPNPVSWEK